MSEPFPVPFPWYLPACSLGPVRPVPASASPLIGRLEESEFMAKVRWLPLPALFPQHKAPAHWQC